MRSTLIWYSSSISLAGVRLNFFPEELDKDFTFTSPRRELWKNCASASRWDWCYWCARSPTTAARARLRRPRRLQPSGPCSRIWSGWWRSWNTWRTPGAATVRERKPRWQHGRGRIRWRQGIYATWKQKTTGIRLLVSGGLSSWAGHLNLRRML